MKSKLIILFCSFLFLQFLSSAQKGNEWYLGYWYGTHYSPYSCITTLNTTLQITSISENIFNGIVTTYVTSNPSKRISVAVAGRIYKDRMTQIQHQVLEVVEPSPCKWVQDCNLCDSVSLKYTISDDQFILNATTGNCDVKRECLGTTYYSRQLKNFTSTAKNSLEDMIFKSGDSVLKNQYIEYVERNRFRPLNNFQGRTVENVKSYDIKSDSVALILYDNAQFDGDSISIFLNGKILVENFLLHIKGDIVKIKIEKNTQNQIIIHALNLGTIPPNTSFVQLKFDGRTEALRTTSDFKKSSSFILHNKDPVF